jgi:hypothetical protein
MTAGPRYTASARTVQRSPLPTALLLLRPLANNGRCLHSRYLANGYCIAAYSEVVAYKRAYIRQYTSLFLTNLKAGQA